MKFKNLIILALLFCIGKLHAQDERIRLSFYFDHNSHTLSEKHKHTIDSISHLFSSDITKVELRGYTNDIGPRNHNELLSQKRANTLKKYFGRYFASVNAEGYGELEGISIKNRRVDMVLTSITENKVITEKSVLSAKHIKEEEQVDIIVEKEANPKVAQKSDYFDYDSKSLKVGDKFILEGVLFAGGRDLFLKQSIPTLEKLLKFMRMNPNIRIKLNGHIYCVDTRYPNKDGYNIIKKTYTLSKDRAAAVYDYLRWRGIDESRMEFHGYAGKFPTGRASKFDRRVEIEIRAIN